MNNQINYTLIAKSSTKGDYQTRFLLQSGAAKINKRSSNSSPHQKLQNQQSSSLIQNGIGSVSLFEFLVITLSERIVKSLNYVYGHLNLKALIQLQKELLLFAFTDNPENEIIFHRHCELGLMTDPSFFDSLLTELISSLHLIGVHDDNVVLECASRFENMRPLLQHTNALMIAKKNIKRRRQPAAEPSAARSLTFLRRRSLTQGKVMSV